MENDTLTSGSSANPPFTYDTVVPGLFQGEFPEGDGEMENPSGVRDAARTVADRVIRL